MKLKTMRIAVLAAFLPALPAANGYAQDIRGFKGGVRIAAASCPTYRSAEL